MSLRKLVLLGPVVFILHVVEEAPGFVAWFNSRVPQGITQRSFLAINAVAFAITVFVALFVAASPDAASALVLASWVGFLMLGNGLFHLVATIADARYCPGVVTGVALYLPYGTVLLRRTISERKLSPLLVSGAAIAGALPMAVHGYLIVFRGSRLF